MSEARTDSVLPDIHIGKKARECQNFDFDTPSAYVLSQDEFSLCLQGLA
ncbi:Uncharacterised protein [Porphyromonas cangingivalis]|uniref:Uncharacterized protein n=1 Tax=Porphyromonas cangingivalis TaxID=36874 RepID=A0A1T4KWM6_PORCN|nr:hypothetical protein SAMN02745205_00882 [Porphyromonas cangingivalis]VEJ04086.1 Uncharacterised protein [Porphyromonas cangingivalis]